MVEILRCKSVSVADGATTLREMSENFRLDATLADCAGLKDIEVRFTISALDARAVAGEIDRLQRLPDLPEIEDMTPGQERSLMLFSLVLFSLWAGPVVLWILGVLA